MYKNIYLQICNTSLFPKKHIFIYFILPFLLASLELDSFANGRLAFSLAWFDMSLRGLKKESFKNSR